MPNVPIDWARVDWLYVAVLAVFAFLSTLIGTLLSFKRAFVGAVLSALLFAAAFTFWTYYPHGLPLPTSIAGQKPPATEGTLSVQAPAALVPSAPAKPSNPVTTIPPPSSTPPDKSQ